ncbi:MAG: sterol desaturase family protein [Pseudanabaenaceae cyanobacterium]|jgi:sterol desaturase/sphingolipid hydroxylase (fatty acid hydroxylase superfamily)
MSSVFSFLVEQLSVPLTVILLSGLLLWVWEIKQPFRAVKYWSIFIQDLKELPIILFFIVLSAQVYVYISNVFFAPILGIIDHYWGGSLVISIPLYLRILIAILIKDTIAYFNHWLMHHHIMFWRTHKWHHFQKSMYWLKGNKNSLAAKIIAKWDFIAFPLLAIPADITFACVVGYSFFTFFVHTNIKWSPWMKYVEWLLVTPRYHLIHHSSNIEYQYKNLGDIFTFCDRIFGTYIDPKVFESSQEEFGLDDEESLTLRMIIGL